MTAQLSREDLREIAYQGSFNELERELARMLLAGMDSEPVAYFYPGDETEWRGVALSEELDDEQKARCIPLYAAPPAPVAVPDEMTSEMMRAVQLHSELGTYAAANLSGAYGLFAEFWKVACRAAMLNRDTGLVPGAIGDGVWDDTTAIQRMFKAKPVTAATVPDGWKLVPVEPTKEMIDAGWSYYMTTKSPSSLGVYGAMLAAAPAAPEQEV